MLIGKRLILAILIMLFTTTIYAHHAVYNPPADIWQSHLKSVVPNRPDIVKEYCQSHSPQSFQASVRDLLKEGVVTSNGIKIRYYSYHQTQRNGLYFITAKGRLSGIYKDKPWYTYIRFFGYQLSPTGPAYIVWSTLKCKGELISTQLQAKPKQQHQLT